MLLIAFQALILVIMFNEGCGCLGGIGAAMASAMAGRNLPNREVKSFLQIIFHFLRF